MKKEEQKVNLTENLDKLSKISEWFDARDEIDVEEGLTKVKEAVVLIKESKGRLSEIENEFETIKKDLDSEDQGESESDF
ncbi:MAG: hypothetical protein WC827_04205 [Candidatus Paceibacterota bacterium]|jgi:hypothetical protein